jgi:hypothetical protein
VPKRDVYTTRSEVDEEDTVKSCALCRSFALRVKDADGQTCGIAGSLAHDNGGIPNQTCALM